jgi:hypothetical protein
MLFTLSPDYSYKELTATLMKAERPEERKRRTVSSYGEVLYVLNTDLNLVFLRGGEYLFLYFLFFAMVLRPNAGHGFLILEVYGSHTTTHDIRYDSSGRVISSSQRPLPDNTQHSQQTDIHATGGIRTHNLSRRATADLCLRPRGHWYRQFWLVDPKNV